MKDYLAFESNAAFQSLSALLYLTKNTTDINLHLMWQVFI